MIEGGDNKLAITRDLNQGAEIHIYRTVSGPHREDVVPNSYTGRHTQPPRSVGRLRSVCDQVGV